MIPDPVYDIVLYFHAPWSKPCLVLHPVMEEVANRLAVKKATAHIRVLKMDATKVIIV